MSDEEAGIKDLFGSDSESDEQPKDKGKAAAADDAEGLEDDLEDDDAGPSAKTSQKRGRLGSEDEDEARDTRGGNASPPYSDDDGDGEDRGAHRAPARLTAPPMEIEAPLLALPPANQKVHLFKPSNMIGIQQLPFNPETFHEEEEVFINERGVESVRPAHQEQIRWRFRREADGSEVKESNARFVRWSDGSLQLLLGEEILDVTPQDISANNYYLYAVRSILQGQTQLSSRLALRPASLDSKLHKRMRDAVDRRHGKVYKVGKVGGLQNPEQELNKRCALIDEKNRGREQLQKKQEKVAFKYRPQKPARLSENYLEEEQDWEEEDMGGDAGGYDDEDDGVTATQRARASLSRPRHVDENAERDAARRLQSAKRSAPTPARRPVAKSRRGALDDNDDDGDDDDDEDEEEDYASTGEGSEEEEREEVEEKQERGGGRGGKDKDAAVKMKARRGVVLSDDED